MTDTKAVTFRELAAKGDGVLVKRGNVWTYPTAENDRSGTNLQIPVESISDEEVQQALRDGHLNPVTNTPMGAVTSVRIAGKGEARAAISVVQAGTPEAGTELPANSRPTHDAGMIRLTDQDKEKLAAAVARPLNRAEGSEARKAQGHGTGGHNATSGAGDRAK